MSVASGETQAAFCDTLVDELVRAGVTDAVICPGSRSTPLTLAIARSSLTPHVRLDERSASFFALGLAKRTRRAVVTVVTSGTAAAELHAAVAEASLDDVPLVVITADRPPELHDIGAPQTIPQGGMFGPLPRFSFDPGAVVALPVTAWRSIANRLVIEAMGVTGPPGPVHANLGFVEPLVASPGALPPGRPDGQPWGLVERPDSVSVGLLEELAGRRGVIVAGFGCGSAPHVVAAAAELGWPVFADPRSGLRAPGSGAIFYADGILRTDLARDLRPEVIIVAGAPPASKVLNEWISTSSDEGATIVRLGLHGPARHASRAGAVFVVGPPDALWRSISSSVGAAPEEWLRTWQLFADAADAAVKGFVATAPLSEPGVARTVASHLHPATTLVVSSSMPLRDLEWFGGSITTGIDVLSNRGANGIDGVVSTALGAASSGEGSVVALVGDLAFLHDVSALVDGLEGDDSCVVVVVDNGGGGIFSFLPQREALSEGTFESYFGTPRRPSIAAVAAGFGHAVASVGSNEELAQVLDSSIGKPGIKVVVCELSSRDENVVVHEQLNKAIAHAVAVADPEG